MTRVRIKDALCIGYKLLQREGVDARHPDDVVTVDPQDWLARS